MDSRMHHPFSVGCVLFLLWAAPALGQSGSVRMIDAGGHRLETLILGEGSPTVVFDAGFSGGMSRWLPAQRTLAEHTGTVAYERAGLRGSEMGPEPRTARQISRELHALLENAGITPPLVLVGHSAGAMYLMVYAAMYPEEVVGMVLVDPATADIYGNMRAQDPRRWDAFTDTAASPSQWRALPESEEQARQALLSMPHVPVVVLTGLRLLPGEWALETPEYMEYWADSHARLVLELPGAEHIVLEDVDHVSILDEPIVAQKILEVLETVR